MDDALATYVRRQETVSVRVAAQFMMSAADPNQFPVPGLPEIAFLGRSNVGKSSVINSLLGEKLAKTSSIPGRTRTINFFNVRRLGKPAPEMLFVDLPGYGYAKVPKQISAEWPKFIEPYLAHRPVLALCIVLIDSNIPPQESDKQLVTWLQEMQRPFQLVATKADRISGGQLATSLRLLNRGLGEHEILPYSTKQGTGRQELWRVILKAAGV